MKNMKLGLLFTTAALAFATGCGEIIGGSDGGSEGAACSSDDNCATGLACHPGLNECRYTCTGDSECPTSEKHCAAISADADAGTGALFCGCTPFTDNSLCETADSATPFCNYQTHTCSASQGTAPGPQACVTTDTQPAGCGYGSECDSTGHCAAVVDDATCTNITSAKATVETMTTPSSGTRVAFSASTSTGAIIYAVTSETADNTFCASGTAFTATIHAYPPAGTTFPAQGSALMSLAWFESDGTKHSIQGSFRPSGYVVNSDGTLSLKVTFCDNAATTSVVEGFSFDNGNGVCATINHL